MIDTDQIMKTILEDQPIEATPFQAIPLETTTFETHQPEELTNLVQPEHEPKQAISYHTIPKTQLEPQTS